jgi:hypothetical protein
MEHYTRPSFRMPVLGIGAATLLTLACADLHAQGPVDVLQELPPGKA